jgi:thiamine kinase-like enzyme
MAPVRGEYPPWLEDLQQFLERLASASYPPHDELDGWAANRVPGGQNNVVYRVTGAGAPALAVKFTTPDGRDRAGREHRALRLLEAAGLDVAPRPLALVRRGLPHEAVVATWLDGCVSERPPSDDAGWDLLVTHYAQVHAATAWPACAPAARAVVTMTGTADGRAVVRAGRDLLGGVRPPGDLGRLLDRLERTPLPEVAAPSVCLCRCDSNVANFVRTDDRWRSVDWENAGWGDPAYELADIRTHPTYAAVPGGRWEMVANRYAELHGDPELPGRAAVYEVLNVCWWAVRLTRMLDAEREPSRLSTRRLAADEVRRTHQRYMAWADDVLVR